jgi:hypothetical protein
MTYNEHLIAYLAYYPETVTIAVPLGRKAAAEPMPDTITLVEHDAYYNEYFDANGVSLARVVFPE